MSLLKRIRYALFPCKHHWVQGAEYWHNRTGGNYDYLLPSPMPKSPGHQANCYVCDKCGESIVVIEKIDDGKPIAEVFHNH